MVLPQLLGNIKMEIHEIFLTLMVFSDQRIFKKLVIGNPNIFKTHYKTFVDTQIELPFLYGNIANS